MISKIKNSLKHAKQLLNTKYFFNFYYGEKLNNHNVITIIKFLLSRFFFLSNIPKLLPNTYYWVNIKGIKFFVRAFNSPVTMDIAFGVYEFWLLKFFLDYVKEGMTVFDIGAHHGYHTLLSAKQMNDKGKVYAFEPDPVNCRYFMKNLEKNKLKSITLYPYALSDQEQETDFYAADGLGTLDYNPFFRAFNVEPEKISIKTQTLDHIVKQENINRIDLIKIDVEGSELRVLKGAIETLTHMKAEILMDVDSRDNEERKELFNLLVSTGYKIYKVGKHMEPITKAAQLIFYINNKQYENVRSIYATKTKEGLL